jgi:hypothetical protein
MIDLFFFGTTGLAFYQKGKRLAIAGMSWVQNVWGYYRGIKSFDVMVNDGISQW